MKPARVFSLGFHADYRCRNSGACCSSGWEIPVTPAAEGRIRSALDTGLLRVESRARPLFRARRGLPEGARVVFGLDRRGRCAFFEAESRLCAVHRQIGPQALPPSCRQFPRVALLTPVGTFVTLSHYCPTAAKLLFREDAEAAIIADPPAFPAQEPWEGLDAREAWPFLRPGVLLGWDGFELWQEQAVRLLLRADLGPEDAVAALRARAARAGDWTPDEGPLLQWLRRASPDPTPAPAAFDAAATTWSVVVAAVPAALRVSSPPLGPGPGPAPDWAAAHDRHVRPVWASFGSPIRRYLAAKVFASWVALQGDGVLAWTRAVETALAVLRVEATRQCLAAPLDEGRLKEAFRRSDLLLLHLARPETLHALR